MSLIATPRKVDLEITSRCNLRCLYCYYFDNPEQAYEDLPTEAWVRFLRELGEARVMEVTLSGGEPLIREDLPEILDAVVENRMRFVLLTNGTLVTRETARLLAGTGRCNMVQISLDGARPEVHDRLRGAGSFEGAVRGIRILQDGEVPLTVRLTIHRHNVRELEETVRFLLEELGLPAIGTNSAGLFGSCKVHAREIQLTPEERLLAMRTLLRLTEVYPGRISALAGPLAEARTWRRMEEARLAGAPPFRQGGRLTGCGCPFTKISVRSDGAMVPCSMIPHRILGWINRDPLVRVWREAEPLRELRERRRLPLSEIEYCRDCPYIPYCTGNCPGLAYSTLGVLDHPSPDACLRDYLAEGGRLP